LYAFVDETGNTGSNVFDEQQPDFFSGALITKANFDVLHGKTLQAICRRNGFETLHASDLGFGPIEQVAREILCLLKKADARFFIARVEKRYLIATKVFDTFFDSGENPAASWTAYNIRPLKLILCFKVATLLTDEIARVFWSMLMARNESEARAKIPWICDAILERVPLLVDQKSREIVTNTIIWSREHPEALDIFIARRQAKNSHMPNMVAFANLLEGLEGFSRRWNRPLKKIVHDRQSQFEGTLVEWHQLFSTASDKPIRLPGETFVFQKVAGSSFEVSSSDRSAGIQIADMVLWLFRQSIAGKILPEGSARILDYAFSKGFHNDFSFRGVASHVEKHFAAIMAADMSPEAMTAGQRILADLERQRLEQIALYEEDGLMPYERIPPRLIGPDTV
jgi:hypothetical protein